jgi:Tfp pilus assembly protein PilW
MRLSGPALRARRRGFTLIELVSSLGAMSVIVVALGSVLMVARAAVPAEGDGAITSVRMQGAMDRMVHDVLVAVDFRVASGDAWELTLPDTDGDEVPDVVVYRWDSAGAAGAQALTRSENGRGEEVLLGHVSMFDMKEGSSGVDGKIVEISIGLGNERSQLITALVPRLNTRGM